MINLDKQTIIYVTRDIERALGLPLNTQGYFIISNFSEFAKDFCQDRKNVLLIKNKVMLDTWELLQNYQAKQFINKQKNAKIIVFKNTLQIEKTCKENNWKLLNPPAKISNEVEEKISQIKWLALPSTRAQAEGSEADGLDLTKYLPNYKVLKCKEIKYKNKSFILQFNRSHTGSGTVLIENEKQLKKIQNKFPDREARIAEYIEGPLFTNNNVVSKNKILLGNISYQITGLKPFSDLPFSTIGNDWALPGNILTKIQIKKYKQIATDVGLRLKKTGWKGLFGIDVVVHASPAGASAKAGKTGKLYLVEINCRQPASTTYESSLQVSKCASKQVTTFEAHLMSLLDMDLKKYKLIEIKNGAQVISRITYHISCIKTQQLAKLNKAGFNTILYNNTEHNSDLLRIQSKTGIMKKHNEFNEVGKKIIKILK